MCSHQRTTLFVSCVVSVLHIHPFRYNKLAKLDWSLSTAEILKRKLYAQYYPFKCLFLEITPPHLESKNSYCAFMEWMQQRWRRQKGGLFVCRLLQTSNCLNYGFFFCFFFFFLNCWFVCVGNTKKLFLRQSLLVVLPQLDVRTRCSVLSKEWPLNILLITASHCESSQDEAYFSNLPLLCISALLISVCRGKAKVLKVWLYCEVFFGMF